MNPSSRHHPALNARTVVTSALLSGILSVAVSVSLRGGPAPPPVRQPAGLTAFDLELEQVQERVATLRRELDDLRSATADRRPAPPTDRTSVATVPAEPPDADHPESPAAMFAALNGTNFFDNGDAWRRARRSGRMAELLALFERAATSAPNDIGAQMALADACIANVVMGVNQGELSRQADAQFDKVLAIDERHWRARFAKAMSYTFWPDVDGKKVEAISHFEILMQQQESAPVEEHQAQVYLALGNLLSNTDIRKARDVWERGARRHPDNDDLRRKARLR